MVVGIPKSERHGYAGGIRSPTYQAWADMRSRCHNPNHKKFADYGARGILVCAAWRSFKTFLADMGERPDGMTLERLDNNGRYHKLNCMWSPQSAQMRNQRRTILVTISGKTLCAKDWAKQLGISYTTVQQRVHRHGWDYIRALTTSVDPEWRLKNLGVK